MSVLPVADIGKPASRFGHGSQRFIVLDSWRGLCALLVAAFHLSASSHFFGTAFMHGTWLFVDFFFVLSGFVITHAYGHRLGTGGDIANFAIRRFGRLWPLHVAVLLMFVGLELSKAVVVAYSGMSFKRLPFTGNFGVYNFLDGLFFLQTTPLAPGVAPNEPSWSISAEWWVYIIFALLTIATIRIARWQRALVVGTVLVAALATVYFGASDLHFGTTEMLALPRCLYGFLTGHIAYRIWRWRQQALRSVGQYEIAAVALLFLFICVAQDFHLVLLSQPVFAMIIILFAQEQGAVSRLMSTRPMARLGELSYSIYMIHWLMIEFFIRGFTVAQKVTGQVLVVPIDPSYNHTLGERDMFTVGGLFGGDVVLITFLVLTIAVATQTRRFVELPGQRFFNRVAHKFARGSEAAAA